jgi:hypothetical protein
MGIGLEIGIPATVVLSVAASVGATRWWIGKEQRLYKNIRREVLFVSTEGCSVEMEQEIFKRNGLFMNIKMAPDSNRLSSLVSEQRLIVLGYTPNSEKFWNVYEKAAANGVYVIIYARDHHIDNEHLNRIRKYDFHSLATTPLRLMADVFAVMATAPIKEDA